VWQAVSIVRIEDGRKRTDKEKKIIPLRWFNPAKCFGVSRERHRERDFILYYTYIERVSERTRGTILLYFTPRSHIPTTALVGTLPKLIALTIAAWIYIYR
jgi:hypothetical protein